MASTTHKEEELEAKVKGGFGCKIEEIRHLEQEVSRLLQMNTEFHGVRANMREEKERSELFLSDEIDKLPEEARVLIETLLARDMDALITRYLLCIDLLTRARTIVRR